MPPAGLVGARHGRSVAGAAAAAANVYNTSTQRRQEQHAGASTLCSIHSQRRTTPTKTGNRRPMQQRENSSKSGHTPLNTRVRSHLHLLLDRLRSTSTSLARDCLTTQPLPACDLSCAWHTDVTHTSPLSRLLGSDGTTQAIEASLSLVPINLQHCVLALHTPPPAAAVRSAVDPASCPAVVPTGLKTPPHNKNGTDACCNWSAGGAAEAKQRRPRRAAALAAAAEKNTGGRSRRGLRPSCCQKSSTGRRPKGPQPACINTAAST